MSSDGLAGGDVARSRETTAAPWPNGPSGVRMNTQGEIEAAICDGITRFEQEYMGRGPKDIHA
jgi:Na+-translocating membrane potential-generating system (MpsC)